MGYAPDGPRISIKNAKPRDPANVPTRVEERSKFKTFPDFLHVTNNWIVSEAFKDMVESLEPGVHQFFPVEVIRKSGEPVEKTYFFFNILRMLDPIIVERSDVQWQTLTSGLKVLLPTGKKRVLRRSVIAGCHVWRDAHMREHVYLSDELVELMQKAKLKKLDLYPVEVAEDE